MHVIRCRWAADLQGYPWRRGQRRRAACDLREAVRLDPSDPDGQDHLGGLLLRMGQWKRAMQDFAETKRRAREKQRPPRLSQIGRAKQGAKPDRTSAVPEVGKH